MDEIHTTYRLVSLHCPDVTGSTAISPELAKLMPPTDYNHLTDRLGLERTDWTDNHGKPRPVRTVLIEAEERPGVWGVGAS